MEMGIGSWRQNNGRMGDRRIEMRDILLMGNYQQTMTNKLALVRREIMEWNGIKDV